MAISWINGFDIGPGGRGKEGLCVLLHGHTVHSEVFHRICISGFYKSVTTPTRDQLRQMSAFLLTFANIDR